MREQAPPALVASLADARAPARPRRCRRTSSRSGAASRRRRVPARAPTAEIQLRQVVRAGPRRRPTAAFAATSEWRRARQAVAGRQGPRAAPAASCTTRPTYGCTICHGGQGRATDKADAHGEVPHWPEPMLPQRYAYAGCGGCHTHLGVPSAAARATARPSSSATTAWPATALDGRGGTLRPGGGGMEGPDLSRGGRCAGFDRRLVRNAPRQEREGRRGRPWRSSVRADRPPRSALPLATFLASRVGRSGSGRGKGAVPLPRLPRLPQGRRRRRRRRPRPHARGREGPGAARLHARARRPHACRTGWRSTSARPATRRRRARRCRRSAFREAEIDRARLLPALAAAQRELRDERSGRRTASAPSASASASSPPTARRSTARSAPPATARTARACATPGMAAVPGDRATRTSSPSRPTSSSPRRSSTGRPGRRMPALGRERRRACGPTRSKAVVALRPHASARRRAADPRPPSRAGSWRRDAKAATPSTPRTCAGCHGANGEGAEGPALNNAVLLEAATDTLPGRDDPPRPPRHVDGGFADASPDAAVLSRTPRSNRSSPSSARGRRRHEQRHRPAGEFLEAAAAAGFGAFVASAGKAWGLEAIDNPLAAYPDRGWERVYRDLWKYDSTFTFLCAPNDTHNCLLNGYVRSGVVTRIGPTMRYGEATDLDGNKASHRWDPRVCQKGLALTRRFYGDRRLQPLHGARRVTRSGSRTGFPRGADGRPPTRVLQPRARRVGARHARRGRGDRRRSR